MSVTAGFLDYINSFFKGMHTYFSALVPRQAHLFSNQHSVDTLQVQFLLADLLLIKQVFQTISWHLQNLQKMMLRKQFVAEN